MKNTLLFTLLFTIALGLASCKNEPKSNLVVEAIPFSEVKITDKFWSPWLQKHATATLPVCMDQIENQTARIQNFENAATKTGEHQGIFFDDSDVYKAMEGMAYSLVNNPNPVIEAKLDEWIGKIAAAQQPDGYLNTYYTLTGLEKRWTNMDKHEMYCGGHMIEAAIAHYRATGSRKFLDVATRFADHIVNMFSPDTAKHWITGHQEVELALVKLYHVTNNDKYLKLANKLLEERGHGYGADIKYTYADDDIFWAVNPGYCQDDVPVREQSVIGGHAVRAMYMYCGMADVAAVTRDQGYIDALNRLWESVVMRNMYITGGIGSSKHNEGFTHDYDLPNEEAYCETCASVGMVLWNQRMNQMSGDAKYIDVLERSLYNGAMAGISLTGNRFFYVNPLESKGGHHRQAWYGCACCPSQISRFLPSIGSYIYGKSDDALWVNLFISSETKVEVNQTPVTIKQITDFPWDGKVTITVNPRESTKFTIKVRHPEWTDGKYALSVNGERLPEIVEHNGYITVNRQWTTNDRIDIEWDITPKVVTADPRVKANEGKRAIQRGPLVYCVEEIDNPTIDEANLSADTKLTATFNPALLGGVTVIKASNADNTLNYIPYFAWDNREAGKMKVWVDYKE